MGLFYLRRLEIFTPVVILNLFQGPCEHERLSRASERLLSLASLSPVVTPDLIRDPGRFNDR